MDQVLIFDTKLKAERDYWLQRLASVNTTSGLAPDYQRHGSDASDSIEIVVPAELSRQVCALAGGSPFLLYTVLMAALKVCLYKYTNQDLISVGSPPLKELDKANALTIVDQLDSEMSFQELLLQVRESLLAAYAHQQYPFSRLLRDLQLESNGSCPLFGVALVLTNLHGTLAETRHDFTLTFTRNADELSGRLEFKPDRFKPASIERLREHFINILRAGVANKKQRLREFELITDSERAQVLYEWNQTRKDYPSETWLYRLFEEQVKKHATSIAVKFTGKALTYDELNRKANQLARRLRRLGVGPDVLVGLHLERSFELVIGMLAVLKAGGAYVPLDLIYPKERLAFMFADAGLKVLLTQPSLVNNLPEHKAATVLLDSWDSFTSESEDNLDDAEVSSDNLAYVLYTSGSTGRPKGVMISHRSLLNYLSWATESYRVTSGDGAPVHSPIGFDLTVTSLFTPLLGGKCVVLLREEEGVEVLLTALRDDDFSLVKLTPAHLEVLKTLPAAEIAAQRARTFVVGGEALYGESLVFWREHNPEVRIINEYGPTETVVGCCVYDVPFGNGIEGSVPIGRPIDNTQLYVLDPFMKLLPLGIAGELYIGGAGLARGYLNRPELTAERFVPDAFGIEGGARLYRTGDLVRARADGTLEFIGRRDRQVKVRGYRIELAEIEAALMRLPEVREAIVALEEIGTIDTALVAYVVGSGSGEEIRASLQAQLPGYMVPSHVVVLERFPLTTHGKVDQRELRALAAAAERNATDGGAPVTEVEQHVAEMWGEVLGKNPVGREANFFDLGGHSLLATQVIARVRERLQVEIPLQRLFEYPTVVQFAGQIEAARQGSETLADRIQPLARDGALPLSFAQQRFWYLDRLNPGNPAYNCCALLRVTGPLNVLALEQAINEISHRHEALRTIFPDVEGWPVQVILPEQSISVLVTDLSGLPNAKAEAAQQRLAAAEAERPFDLSTGPLIRVGVRRMDEREHLVQVTMHHIVSDGWSLGVFCREVTALYEAFAAGTPTPLPALHIQYGDFAAWQRRHLQGDKLAKQRSYWKKQLAGIPPVLELPSDRRRPDIATFHGAKFHFMLPKALSESLNTLSRNEGATLFMVLLAAFDVLLYRYTYQTDIVVGTAIANRNRRETEPLMGFFVNMVVMRTDMNGNPPFHELLARVKQMTLAAYEHQDVPIEQIIEMLQPQRSLNRSPLYQVEFTLQNAPLEPLQTRDLTFTPVNVQPDASETDLNLIMSENSNGLAAEFIYSTDLFDPPTIERMADHFQTLLQGIVEEPQRRILELSLTTNSEAQSLLAQWDGGATILIPV